MFHLLFTLVYYAMQTFNILLPDLPIPSVLALNLPLEFGITFSIEMFFSYCNVIRIFAFKYNLYISLHAALYSIWNLPLHVG